MKMPQMKKE